jgi:ketosteroid isomerase-like protein
VSRLAILPMSVRECGGQVPRERAWFVYLERMSSKRLPPVAAVIGFIDCINRGDIDGLGRLMTDDHELVVFGEDAVHGRARNTKGWEGYASAYPEYVIYPRAVAEPHEGRVAVLGYTTGSHLGLADDEERKLSVIWLAEVRDGQLCSWRLLEDTPQRRAELGLTAPD